MIKKLAASSLIVIVVLLISAIAFAQPAQAAYVFHSGLEIGDFNEWDSTTGGVSVDNVTVNTGNFSMQVGSEDYVTRTGSAKRGSFYVYVDSFTLGEEIRILGDTINTNLRVTTTTQQECSSPSGSNNEIFSNDYTAQTFTTGSAYTIFGVALKLSKVGTPNDLVVSVQGVDGSNHPDNSDLCSETISEASITNGAVLEVFFSSGTSLSASTMYAVVLKQSGDGGDASNAYGQHRDTSGNPYANGAMEYTNDGGSTWSEQVNYDTYFITYSGLHAKLYQGATAKGTGTTAINMDTQTRLSVSCDGAGENAKAYINGNEELSLAMGASANITTLIGGINSGTFDMYFDDIIFDNTDSTNDLGDIRVIRSVPIAEGTHDDWKDTGNGAQTYDDVDEDPPAATADYAWYESDGTQQEQTWTTTTMDTLLGADDHDPEAISTWFYYTTGGGGANQYATYMRDNGTDYSTWIDDIKVATWVNRYDATMPNGGAEWTEARTDAYEIGMMTDDANKDIWCYTAYKMIAYTEPAAAEPDISISPISYDFGTVATSSTTNTTTTYFTITNNSSMQTDQTISVTTSSWSSGGIGWTHDDTGTAGANTAAMKAQRGGVWGASVVVVKNASPNYIYENCPASENYSFGLSLLAPTSLNDGDENTITVRISAVVG